MSTQEKKSAASWPRLLPARISLAPDAPPRAEDWDDVYFSAHDGWGESGYVFLQGCDLPRRWQEQPARAFTIGETGFGTGLNFLAAWDLWRRTAGRHPQARLDFISVEQAPLTIAQMQSLPRFWPEDVQPLADALHQNWPEPHPGWHRMIFEEGRVTLTLGMGEAGALLGDYEAQVDAWFLDGFAPRKDPQIWREEVLAALARLSRTGCHLASFTAVGDVRRGLAAHGFAMQKRPGWGQKREMLTGIMDAPPAPQTALPMAQRPAALEDGAESRMVIIGGGIAGWACARALARYGQAVTLLEAHHIGAGSSGNPAPIIMPRLTKSPSAANSLYETAFRHAQAAYGEHLKRCGVLQLAQDAAAADHLRELAACGAMAASACRFISADEAGKQAGFSLPHPAFFVPQAGWLDSASLLAEELQHPRITVKTATKITHLQQDQRGLWSLIDAAGRIVQQAEIVILANGMGAAEFAQTSWLPLTARRGQLTLAKMTKAPGCIINHGGHIVPLGNGRICFGATGANEDQADCRAEDDRHNLERAAQIWPHESRQTGSWAGLRCTTPDRLPCLGPVPERAAFMRDFTAPATGSKQPLPPVQWQKGLYLCTGLGSRGFTTAPLLGAALAAMILARPAPLPASTLDALHPARFLWRDLKRGKPLSPAQANLDQM